MFRPTLRLRIRLRRAANAHFVQREIARNDMIKEPFPSSGKGFEFYLRTFFATFLIAFFTAFFAEAPFDEALPLALAALTRVRICSCR